MKPTTTLYQIADAEIRSCIKSYLALAKASKGLTDVRAEFLPDQRTRTILLAGLGSEKLQLAADAACEEWRRRQAIPFDLEAAVTHGVYENVRSIGERFLHELEEHTSGFTHFEPAFIKNNAYLLPLIQHLAGIFSKAALKRIVGNVSDVSISGPAAERLSELLKQKVVATEVNKGQILQRLESTLEGIVRDLVGRVLLESIVDAALRAQSIQFKRENEYTALAGVIYNFRADFVLPDDVAPLAFIEVRKSSSRHASLYAKDKMFSAINWKGHNKNLLGILVVDGEWTGETLRVMANVFDYVVPIGRITEVVETIKGYLAGDKSKLKWLIEFRITASIPNPASAPSRAAK